MATENIMMDAVKRGGDRQELHEKIRVHSMAAGMRVKTEGLENDLIDRLVKDPAFGLTRDLADALLDASKYVARAPKQTEEYVAHIEKEILVQYQEKLGMQSELSV